MSDPILDDLNDEQRQAVLHQRGPLMVLAGAGSGKTRVVTRRIARILRDGARSSQILAMTFTNKAAREMGSRVEELGGSFVKVATFHSICARFLRQEHEHIGFPRDYSIYDTYDRDSLIKQLMGDLGLDRSGVKPSQAGQLISKMKNAALKPEDSFLGDSEVARVVGRLFVPYGERLRQLGAMDFDDLLLHFLQLLKDQPEVAERYRERFPFVLVDEFQDTNRVQYDLLRQLTQQDSNVCVVGDPDQSIYGFRGAEIRNILDFGSDYPGTVVVRLEQNYRSTKTILHAAEAVIANNKQRLDKRLRTDNDKGEPLLRLRLAGPAEEADAIAGRIQELLADGAELQQIAIFYRAHWLSRSLEQALKERGLPYVIVGGLTFFERREIKDLLAYLRVLVNPLDDISMERVINVPPRGLGKSSVEKLRTAAAAHGMSLREAVGAFELHAALPPKARKALAALAKVLDDAATAGQTGTYPALKQILEGVEYLEYATGLGDPEDIAREENIAELISDVVEFDDKNGAGLAGYLQHVALLTSADRGGDGPSVQMMTVHAAKGLEFDHVFLAGLEEGVFPSMRSAEARDGLEEERRLMYVALTRGRRTVCLSHTRERMIAGSMQHMRPSMFLNEIPKDCITEATGGWRGLGSSGDEWSQDGYDAVHDGIDVELAVGARVQHAQFGTGTVRSLSGQGMLARTVVRFDDGVERTLILEYAGLRPVDRENSW